MFKTMTAHRSRFLLPRRVCTAAAAIAMLGLAACAAEGTPPPCPPAAVPTLLDTATAFTPGGGQDLTEVQSVTSITALFGECVYRSDGLEIDLSIRMIAERGPADRDRTVKTQYFVAVEDGSGNITAKQIYDLELAFEGNSRRVGRIEELTVTVPVPASGSYTGTRVLAGLQLTADQLEYNRRTQAR